MNQGTTSCITCRRHLVYHCKCQKPRCSAKSPAFIHGGANCDYWKAKDAALSKPAISL